MHYRYPVYVELVRTPDCQPTGLHTRALLMEAHSLINCGGVWESIGPIELSPRFVPFGDTYTIQVTFLEADPPPFGRSVAVSCLQVVSNANSAARTQWSQVKALYR
jgi:hypothetical protein